MSCRVAPDEMLITPTSVRYDVLRAQDIVHMKLDGTVLEGELQPSSEWRMHAAVYKAYGETNAVFHTHSPYATAFARRAEEHPRGIDRIVHLFGRRHPLRGLRRAGDRGRRHERHPCAQGPRRLHAWPITGRARRGEGTLRRHILRAEYIEDVAKIYAYAKAIAEPVALDTL